MDENKGNGQEIVSLSSISSLLNLVKSTANTDEVCLYCGDTGRTEDNPDKCDECGREYRVIERQNSMNTSSLYIPVKYREEWQKEKTIAYITQSIVDDKYKNKCEKWVTTLELAMKTIQTGKLVPETWLLEAPNSYGKTRWAYALLTEAELMGFKVYDIVDVIDLPDMKELDEILATDVLVLRLVEYRVEDAMKVLNYVVPKRESKDKFTIIITEMPFQYLKRLTNYISFKPRQITTS